MLKSLFMALAALFISTSASAGNNCAHAAEHAQELAVASAQPVIQSAVIQSQVSAQLLSGKLATKQITRWPAAF
jgi:ABC-type proline/glycine betaine transport system substrate-binding protein